MSLLTSTINPSLERSRWIRLRTLVYLRWIAIVGQVGAVLVAEHILMLRFESELCYLVIGLSLFANIVASILYPENQRVTELQIAGSLFFDIAQLSLLMFLTGGLNNPFALLVLAPIAVGAAALRLGTIVVLVAFTIGLVTLVGLFHQPLRTQEGFLLQIPLLIEVGFWIAIMTGVIFVATLIHRVSNEIHSMGDALMATQLALSREQKLTDLGGVVAAAAHELGTPLATIKLISSELIDDLDKDSDLYEDAVLIGQQADRCRDILRSMGRAGNDDNHMRTALLSALVEDAAEPHINRGKQVSFSTDTLAGSNSAQPMVHRAPEIMHGLRNLVQNAVDFARSEVWVDIRWSETQVRVTIADDGPGYPGHIIGRIGDPFVRSRERRADQRPGYEGMGLGLFIAKTLLERSGAELTFANGKDPFLKDVEGSNKKGAVVEVAWDREAITPTAEESADAFQENQPLETSFGPND